MTLADSPPAPAVTVARAGTGRHTPLASIARGALHLLSTQPLTWTASLLAVAFLPKYLGDDGFGAFAVAVTITGLAGLLVPLGVPDFLARRVAQQPARAQVDGGAALVLLTGFAAAVALVLALALPAAGVLADHAGVLRVLLLGMVVNTANIVLLALLRGQERHARFAWFNAISAAAGVVVGVGVLAAGWGMLAFVVASVSTGGLVLVAGWHAAGFRLQREALDVKLWRELAQGGLPFLGNTAALYVYGEVDKILLALLAGQAALGWYAAAYRVIGIPMFIPTMIMMPLLPALSRAAPDPAVFRHTIRHSVTLVLILTVPICAMTIALAPAVPEIMPWPHEFSRTVPLMMVLALHAPVVAVDMVLASALFALHRERAWLKVALVATVFNPVLNLALIPLCQGAFDNGGIGAAIATVATELVMFMGALVLLPSGTLGRETASITARVIAAGVCGAVAAALLRELWLPLAIVAGGVVMLVAGVALRVLQPAEARALVRTTLARRRGQAVEPAL